MTSHASAAEATTTPPGNAPDQALFQESLDVTRLRGYLPPPPPIFAETPFSMLIGTTVQEAVDSGEMAMISGPVGVGKSTAVAQAARDLDKTVVYVLMPDAPSVKASLETIWESMTRTAAASRETQIRRDIENYLLRHEDVALVIDDAHYISTRGLRVLTNLWNSMAALRGQGVPMILVGNDLPTALKNVPEIGSRSVTRRNVGPLAGEALYAFLATIEPRTAATDHDVLLLLDRQHFRGELRKWVQFLNVVRRHQQSGETGALEQTEIRQALLRQGWIG